jgi:DNA polymerase III sliding clamp (beta) subunit (PCNA family)
VFGKTLKRLAEVAEVAKLDLQPGAMTIAPIGDDVLAWYSGAYAAGGVLVDNPGEIQRPVSISAMEFRDLVGLFEDDAVVSVRPGESALLMAAGKRRVSLRYIGKPDTELFETVWNTPIVGSVKLAAFETDAMAASSVTAVTSAAPILTGIRMIISGKAMGLQAMNGSSIIMEVTLVGEATEKIETVLPATELQPAFKVLSDEETIGFGMSGRTLILKGARSVVKLPLMAGKWPKAEAIRNLTFVDELSIPAGIVKTLIQAARVYKTEHLVTIRPTEGGHVILETEESELGQFQEAIEGMLSRPYKMAVADLDAAVKLTGDTLDLQFAATVALVKAGARRLFINLQAVGV